MFVFVVLFLFTGVIVVAVGWILVAIAPTETLVDWLDEDVADPRAPRGPFFLAGDA